MECNQQNVCLKKADTETIFKLTKKPFGKGQQKTISMSIWAFDGLHTDLIKCNCQRITIIMIINNF